MSQATVSTNEQHSAINMSSKSMKKPLLGDREAGRDTYSEATKLGTFTMYYFELVNS